jgi:flagellar motor switch protein FliN/FliY
MSEEEEVMSDEIEDAEPVDAVPADAEPVVEAEVEVEAVVEPEAPVAEVEPEPEPAPAPVAEPVAEVGPAIDEVELSPLESPNLVPLHNHGDLSRLTDVTVELSVEVGRTRMTLGQALALGPGSVVALSRSAREPVDLLVNGKPVAHGEVVVIDDDFGLRITGVIEVTPDPHHGEDNGFVADAA